MLKFKIYGVKAIFVFLLLFLIIGLYSSFFLIGGIDSTELFIPGILVLGTAVYVAFLIFAYLHLGFCSDKVLKRISCILLISFFVLLIISGTFFCAIPTVDLKNITIEAINMLKTGSITNTNYFGVYPHQNTLTIILYWIFHLGSIFKIENYRLLGVLFNVLCIWGSVYFYYKIVVETKGEKLAVFSLICIVFSPVFYLYVSYYYTDTVSIIFIMMSIWFFLRAIDAKRKHIEFLYFFVASFLYILVQKYELQFYLY